MTTIRTVILANPCSAQDPIFHRDGDGYLFPRVMGLLRAKGVIHDPVLSVSEGVAAEYKDILSQWDLPCQFSGQSLPQHRLRELAEQDGGRGYLLLTSYSYMIERERIAEACRLFADTGVDCVNHAGVSTSNSFCLLSRKAIEELAQFNNFALTPFVAARYLAETACRESIVQLEQSQGGSVRAFLNQLLYSGDRGMLPLPFLAGYFQDTPEAALFTEASYAEHLYGYFGVQNADAFTSAGEELFRDSHKELMAGQVHLVKRMLPHLPENRDSFVELGFGQLPTASLLLLNLFRRGHAVEPFVMEAVGCEYVEFLSRNVAIPEYVDLEKTKDCRAALENLDIHTTVIQECGIAKESVDYIFSKTVFEHVKDVPEVSRIMYDTLRPGGRMYHIIDMRDHVDNKTIRFDFLRHDKETWAARDESTNLWRLSDFVALWSDIGFRVEVVERLSRVQEVPDRHPCWDAYDPDDLFCYHAIVVAEK